MSGHSNSTVFPPGYQLPDYEARLEFLQKVGTPADDNLRTGGRMNANGTQGCGISNCVGLSPAGDYDVSRKGSLPQELAAGLPTPPRIELDFKPSAEDSLAPTSRSNNLKPV